MEPPICVICGKDFRDEGEGGDTVIFALSGAEKERSKMNDKPGMSGQIPGMQWFCNDHLPFAKKYKHLTFEEALPKIKEEAGIS